MARNRFAVRRVQVGAEGKRLGIFVSGGFYPLHVTDQNKTKKGDFIGCQIFKYKDGYGNRFGEIAGYVMPGSIRTPQEAK